MKPTIKRIFAYGDLSILNKKSVAIIGSRNCSEYGKKIAKQMTEVIAKNDVVIVSGMASGIDTVAHKMCIESGGKTIAVLGSGFNNIFPKENIELFHKIIDSGGLVISEHSLDEPVQKKNFPKRNRIISGLAEGVLVVEAAYRSGTSITVKYAKLQGKKVFCVPNCIGNKNSYGSIELAKNGAKIVSTGEEVLNELGINCSKNKKNNIEENMKIIKELDNQAKRIYQCLRENEALDSNQISYSTGFDVAKVNQVLTCMELDEIIECTGINKYKLRNQFCE